MTEKSIQSSECSYCRNAVDTSDEFCPDCGSLFDESMFCVNHPEREAKGGCIICCLALCRDCGGRVNNRFLCGQHCKYEIYQGMARVFGGSDTVQMEYAKSCLEQAGLHPFLYSRKASPIHLGGPDYTLFRASGEYNGHIINEIKVMVPCQEVIEAERVLSDLKLID